MGNLILLTGKSASGKDTILPELKKILHAKYLPNCTTRPMRAGESEGNPYFFVKPAEADNLLASKKYKTESGIWTYGFKREELNSEHDYVAVVSLTQVHALVNYYGKSHRIVLVEITTDEEERIAHAIERENKNKKSANYAELCRRILTDKKDYCQANILEASLLVDDFIHVYNDYTETPEEIAYEIYNAL